MRLNLWSILEHQGRTITWLARTTGFSEDLFLSIKCGRRRATPKVRRACEIALGIPEAVLFSMAAPLEAAAPT